MDNMWLTCGVRLLLVWIGVVRSVDSERGALPIVMETGRGSCYDDLDMCISSCGRCLVHVKARMSSSAKLTIGTSLVQLAYLHRHV